MEQGMRERNLNIAGGRSYKRVNFVSHVNRILLINNYVFFMVRRKIIKFFNLVCHR